MNPRFQKLLPLTLLLLTACDGGSPPPAPPTTTTAPATQPTPRIISTVPAATEMLKELNAASLLVGVSKYDVPSLPAAQANLPVVGDYESLNYELLLSLHPTALIIQKAPSAIPPKLQDLCRDQKITLINLHLETTTDLKAAAEQLGKITHMEAQAKQKIDQTLHDLAAVQTDYASGNHPRVVYLASTISMMAVGDHTFMNELLTLAGGNNVARTLGLGYPTLNRETLIALKPDVLLIGAPGEPGQMFDNDPRLTPWLALPIPAAVQKRIYLVTDPNTEMLTFDVAARARLLAQMIHLPAPNTPTLPATTEKSP